MPDRPNNRPTNSPKMTPELARKLAYLDGELEDKYKAAKSAVPSVDELVEQMRAGKLTPRNTHPVPIRLSAVYGLNPTDVHIQRRCFKVLVERGILAERMVSGERQYRLTTEHTTLGKDIGGRVLFYPRELTALIPRAKMRSLLRYSKGGVQHWPDMQKGWGLDEALADAKHALYLYHLRSANDLLSRAQQREALDVRMWAASWKIARDASPKAQIDRIVARALRLSGEDALLEQLMRDCREPERKDNDFSGGAA